MVIWLHQTNSEKKETIRKKNKQRNVAKWEKTRACVASRLCLVPQRRGRFAGPHTMKKRFLIQNEIETEWNWIETAAKVKGRRTIVNELGSWDRCGVDWSDRNQRLIDVIGVNQTGSTICMLIMNTQRLLHTHTQKHTYRHRYQHVVATLKAH